MHRLHTARFTLAVEHAPIAATIGERLAGALAQVQARLDAERERSGPFAEMLAHVFRTPGKRLRATLVIGAAALDGGERIGDGDVVAAAAALELLHEASLLHDDICDGSVERRGAPSVAARFGVRCASLCGGWLVGSALATLGELAARIGVTLDFAGLAALSEAQILETAPPQATLPAERDRYLRVARGKTGALFRFACAAGYAVGGGEDAAKARALDEAADALAIAYQVIDDALDLEGARTLGKAGGSDLARGLATWPILEWLRTVENPERESARLSQRGDLAGLRAEILASGAVSRSRAFAQAELVRATRALDGIGATATTEILRGVIARVAER